MSIKLTSLEEDFALLSGKRAVEEAKEDKATEDKEPVAEAAPEVAPEVAEAKDADKDADKKDEDEKEDEKADKAAKDDKKDAEDDKEKAKGESVEASEVVVETATEAPATAKEEVAEVDSEAVDVIAEAFELIKMHRMSSADKASERRRNRKRKAYFRKRGNKAIVQRKAKKFDMQTKTKKHGVAKLRKRLVKTMPHPQMSGMDRIATLSEELAEIISEMQDPRESEIVRVFAHIAEIAKNLEERYGELFQADPENKELAEVVVGLNQLATAAVEAADAASSDELTEDEEIDLEEELEHQLNAIEVALNWYNEACADMDDEEGDEEGDEEDDEEGDEEEEGKKAGKKAMKSKKEEAKEDKAKEDNKDDKDADKDAKEEEDDKEDDKKDKKEDEKKADAKDDKKDSKDDMDEEIEEAKKFIQKALSDPGDKGRLHRALGVPEGEKIPMDDLKKAAERKDKVGKMARFALTLKKFKEEAESALADEGSGNP